MGFNRTTSRQEMEISVFVMVVDDGALSLSIMLVICNPAAYPYYLCFDDYSHY